MAPEQSLPRQSPECLCGNRRYDVACEFTAPPVGEVRFEIAQGGYFRQLLRCRECGHFRSVHDMDMSQLYSGGYVDSTYGDAGIQRAFARITGMDPGKSDNVGRVERILQFASVHFGYRSNKPSILDVGSGLCVFLHRVKTLAGWDCTALDPDPRAVRHAQETVGVKGICADFTREQSLGSYDVIAFNKVLEHVVDPVAMLAKADRHLRGGGFVYVELPDGQGAAEESLTREEFFVDHHHVFSLRSIRLLAQKAGFGVVQLERLREPSGKYTLRAFLDRGVRGG